jgi:Tol biopolymer transport system component
VLRFDWYLDRNRIVYTRLHEGELELRAANLTTGEDRLLYAGSHTEMIVAPDGSAVALVKSTSHFDQQLFLLRLEQPLTADGLPQVAGELERLTGGQGRWHVHNGGWSPDARKIVYSIPTARELYANPTQRHGIPGRWWKPWTQKTGDVSKNPETPP